MRSSAVHHRLLVAGGQQVGEVLHRDAQAAHVGQLAERADVAGVRPPPGSARAAARTTPSAACGTPGAAEARPSSPSPSCRPASACAASSQASGTPSRRACSITSGRAGRGRSRAAPRRGPCGFSTLAACLDAVGVVEQHAEIADAADAGLRAHRRLPGLDARVAEDALLGLAGGPVVVDLLVRAARHAHAPAAALVLVDQHDAVLLALVDRARGAGRDAGRD